MTGGLAAKRVLALLLAVLVALPSALAAHYYTGVREAEATIEALRAENAMLADEVESLRPVAEDPVPEKQPSPEARSAPDVLRETKVIKHALGTVKGITMLNSLESFLASYEAGARVFEADFRLTSDDQVVLRHDWRANWQRGISETSIPTLEEFRKRPILHRYTPLSFRDLLLLLEQYPDVCIITDTKYIEAESVTKEFEAMVADAHALGLTCLFDQMIIQVYNQLMFKVVDNIYPFPHYIYTLYMDGFEPNEEDFRQRAEFCRENGILGLTMWHYWWREAFAPLAEEYGLMVFVHTVNDADYAQRILDSGVDAVYTDKLLPDMLT